MAAGYSNWCVIATSECTEASHANWERYVKQATTVATTVTPTVTTPTEVAAGADDLETTATTTVTTPTEAAAGDDDYDHDDQGRSPSMLRQYYLDQRYVQKSLLVL